MAYFSHFFVVSPGMEINLPPSFSRPHQILVETSTLRCKFIAELLINFHSSRRFFPLTDFRQVLGSIFSYKQLLWEHKVESVFIFPCSKFSKSRGYYSSLEKKNSLLLSKGNRISRNECFFLQGEGCSWNPFWEIRHSTTGTPGKSRETNRSGVFQCLICVFDGVPVTCMCSQVPVTFTAGLLKSQKVDREIFVVNGLLTIEMDPGQVVISLN